MGSWHDYAINGMKYALFGTCSVVADCDWRKLFLIKEKKIYFFCHDSSIWQKSLCSHCQTKHCSVSGPWKQFQNLAASFVLQTFLTIFDHSFSMYGCRYTFLLKNSCQVIRHLHYYLEVIFVSFQKYKSFGHTSRKTDLFILQKKFSAPDTWKCIEDIDSRLNREIVTFLLAA